MPLALLVADNQDAIALLPWGVFFARSREESLLLCFVNSNSNGQGKSREEIDLSKTTGDEANATEYQAVLDRLHELNCVYQPDSADAPGDEKTGFRLVRLSSGDPNRAIHEEISKSDIDAIMLRRSEKTGVQSLDNELVHAIVSDVACEVIQVSPGPKSLDEIQSVMVPVGPGSRSAPALRLGENLATKQQIPLTGVYVEPNVDECAQQVGSRILDRILQSTLGKQATNIEKRIVLDDKLQRGLRSVVGDYDAVILSTRPHGRMHRWLIGGITEGLLTLPDGPNVIAIRSSTPLSGRIALAIDRTLRYGIPQLERSKRIQMVERIQSSSKWDVDFIALTCLSTMIATGGLIQNSAAVVIGAMLVAPLMTPLLGIGLSLVQGNLILMRTAVQSVIRGFLLAVGIAFAAGWIWSDPQITSEMAARGAPGILDLMVAFVSGMAAAYAIGRPNLLSALPGVAIAAALVPPIATLGISLASGQWWLSLGSGVLFATNIVSIVLGTACSFLAVGIRGSHTHGTFQSRTLRVAIVLVILFVSLGIYESLPKAVIPEAFRDQLETYIESHDDVQLISVTRGKPSDHNTVAVLLQSPKPLAAEISDYIRTLAEAEFDRPIRVRVTNELVTVIDANAAD